MKIGTIEYVRHGHLEDMRARARNVRLQAQMLEAEAKTIEAEANELESRWAEYDKFKPKDEVGNE